MQCVDLLLEVTYLITPTALISKLAFSAQMRTNVYQGLHKNSATELGETMKTDVNVSTIHVYLFKLQSNT